MTGLTLRQRWAHIALGMQQDVASYQALQDLLRVQFHAALRHDAQAMEAVAQQITEQASQLDAARKARVEHVHALLPHGARPSMTQAIAQLQGGLQQQLLALWQQLEAQVQACKTQNVRNCQLIMEQAQTMRQVIGIEAAQDGIYAPR